MSRLTTPRKAAAGESPLQKALDNADIRYHGARPLRVRPRGRATSGSER